MAAADFVTPQSPTPSDGIETWLLRSRLSLPTLRAVQPTLRTQVLFRMACFLERMHSVLTHLNTLDRSHEAWRIEPMEVDDLVTVAIQLALPFSCRTKDHVGLRISMHLFTLVNAPQSLWQICAGLAGVWGVALTRDRYSALLPSSVQDLRTCLAELFFPETEEGTGMQHSRAWRRLRRPTLRIEAGGREADPAGRKEALQDAGAGQAWRISRGGLLPYVTLTTIGGFSLRDDPQVRAIGIVSTCTPGMVQHLPPAFLSRVKLIEGTYFACPAQLSTLRCPICLGRLGPLTAENSERLPCCLTHCHAGCWQASELGTINTCPKCFKQVLCAGALGRALEKALCTDSARWHLGSKQLRLTTCRSTLRKLFDHVELRTGLGLLRILIAKLINLLTAAIDEPTDDGGLLDRSYDMLDDMWDLLKKERLALQIATLVWQEGNWMELCGVMVQALRHPTCGGETLVAYTIANACTYLCLQSAIDMVGPHGRIATDPGDDTLNLLLPAV